MHPANKEKSLSRFFLPPVLSTACKLALLHRFVDHADIRNEPKELYTAGRTSPGFKPTSTI